MSTEVPKTNVLINGRPSESTPDNPAENKIKDVDIKTINLDKSFLISKPESQRIKNVISLCGTEFSPRLLKRYTNIYLIARHLLIIENENKIDPIPEYIPPAGFIQWLALSILFPFESAKFVQYFEEISWDESNWDEGLFDGDGQFIYTEILPDRSIRPKAPFCELDIRGLHRFGHIHRKLLVNITDIKNTLHILNCFNLVLD
jgi:hypothetical protein